MDRVLVEKNLIATKNVKFCKVKQRSEAEEVN